MEIIKQNIRQIIIWLLPILILAIVTAVIGLKLGVDFASANVLQVTFGEAITKQEINEIMQPVGRPIKIEFFDNGRTNIYFQNVSLEELGNSEVLETERSDVSDLAVFAYEPTTLIYINYRIVYGLLIGFFAYLVLMAYILRGKGINRFSLVQNLFVDLLLALSLVFVIFGMINMLGLVGVLVSTSTLTFGLSYLVFLATLNALIASQVKTETNDLLNQWTEASQYFIKNTFRNYVLAGLILLSISFVELQMLWLIPVFVLAFVYTVYLFTQIKLVLIGTLKNLFSKTKLGKNTFLSKTW